MGINFGKWIGNAVKTAGKPFELAGQGLQAAGGAVTHEIGKIPVIGKPLGATFDAMLFPITGPAIMAGKVLDGQRIDHVALGALKGQLQDFKEAGPYAQMIVSFVPGIGTGISAAIGAGLALANGQPISSAMLAAVKGALPGGPIAGAAFDVAQQGVNAAAHHTKVTWDLVAKAAGSAGADLAGLPDAAKQALLGALTTVGGMTRGETPAIAAADGALVAAQSALPPAAAKALQVGVALAHAKELQSKAKPVLSGTPLANQLMNLGRQIQATDPTVAAARDQIKLGKNGFDIGIGTQSQAITTNELMTIRSSLNPADRQGFDMAVSLHIGRVANMSPQGLGPKGLAGYHTTLGMQGAESASKTTAMTALAAHPVIAVGANHAVDQVEVQRAEHHENVLLRLWHWIKHFLST